jgi:hypothetical protein
VRLEGLGQLKNPMTSEIEPATFLFVAQCLNQLRYRAHAFYNYKMTEDMLRLLKSIRYRKSCVDGHLKKNPIFKLLS